MQAFMVDFLLGGVSGAVSKTLTAPIERVKLVVQTQDANPKIRSGEVPRYTGMVDCAQRILKEQGLYRFWDGNFTNCLRYFPTQAFNLAFKDTFKKMFPKYNPKTEFWKFFGANLVSGGLAAAASMTIVYPLDYARTRLASDVGSGKATFSGLGDCIVKTAKGPGGFFALYTGFGVSVCGIIGYRGLQLGTFDTITGLNPWLEPLEEGPRTDGRRQYLRRRPDGHHHRSRRHLSLRHGATTPADAVGETCGGAHLQGHCRLFQEDRG